MGEPDSDREIESLRRQVMDLRRDGKLARSILENSVDGIVTFDDRGGVLSFNAAAERIFRYRAGEMFGQSFKKLISEACHGQFESCLAAHLRTNEARIVGIDQQLLGRRKDGSFFPMELTICAFVLDGGRVFAIGTRDVTERWEVLEQRLRLATVLSDSNDAVTVFDVDGVITAWNRGAVRMYGYTESEALGMNIRAIVPNTREAKAMAFLEQLTRLERVGSFETQRVTQDGRVLDVWLSVTILRDETGTPIAVATTERDITQRIASERELRENQQRLRSLTSELSLAEERERHRIASDLHDQVGGTLAAVKIKLDTLRQAAVTAPQFRQALGEIGDLVKATIESIRSLTFDLASPILYEVGLEAALESLTEQFKGQSGTQFQFRDDGRHGPLPGESHVVIYHTVRELLMNATKHAHAGSIHVSIRRGEGNVWINVEDDGIGFETPKAGFHVSRSGGFGLYHAGQRLEHLGGRLEVESEPGRGTVVTIVAPLLNASQVKDQAAR